MSNNAFRSGNRQTEKKGFLETHGMALGGGVLALGIMVLGSQYIIQQENLSADVTDETSVATVEATEEPIATVDTTTTETTDEVSETTDEVSETTSETTTDETTDETTETVGDETETITDETVETATDETVVTSTDTSSTETTTTITNPVTDNIAPLYAEPVETEEAVAATAEPTPSLAPATLLNFIPQSPAVPAAVLNLETQKLQVVESQQEMNLNPAIPSEINK